MLYLCIRQSADGSILQTMRRMKRQKIAKSGSIVRSFVLAIVACLLPIFALATQLLSIQALQKYIYIHVLTYVRVLLPYSPASFFPFHRKKRPKVKQILTLLLACTFCGKNESPCPGMSVFT